MEDPQKVNKSDEVCYRSWEFPELGTLTKEMEESLLESSKNIEMESEPDKSNEEYIQGVIESVKQKAYQEGIEEGIRQSSEVEKDKDTRISNILNQIVSSKSDLANDIETFLIHSVGNIVSNIFKEEMSINSKHIESAIIECVNSLDMSSKVQIFINSKTADFVKSSSTDLAASSDVEVVVDDVLQDYECLVKMDKSFTEIDLSKRLNSALSVLLKEGNK